MFQWDYEDPLALAAGEPNKANQALHDYAKLGPGRSLSALATAYQNQTDPRPPTKTLSTLKEWSSSYSWVARVGAFDDGQRAAERATLQRKREQRAAELADRNWDLASKLAAQVAEMLNFPLAQVEQVTKRRQLDDGRTTEIHMNVVKPAKWSFQTAAIMADVAAKLAGLAVGDTGAPGGPSVNNLTPRQLEEMPLDQLLALRAELDRRR
jgi:hypothetical protein